MYRIAGIDVHKRMLVVVVSDVEVGGDYEFESRRWGTLRRSCERWPLGWSSSRCKKW